ncbi:FtsX-like permease family protein, partial [Pseudobutyrivibrio sp.]|uniref:FtsX-like permease family protein n=1 Tax=Pseudobutyrivibrio sp. TaxID=2014367 RepID=UPI001B4A2D7F
YNLGVLSYIEKVREIATMKVLGFQSMNIRFILMQQNLTVTGLGAIIGVPLGYLSLTAMLDAFLLDDSDLIMDLSLLPFIVAIIGTFLVSVLINIVVTAKINEINMVEALKGVE